jgi:hypothetical protein
MLVEDIPARLDVAVVLQGLVHLEVVAPAGDLDAVVAKGLGFLAKCVKGQVGPLAAEEGDWSGHDITLL